MALVDIKVPDIGDFEEVSVIELLVKAGDTIKVDQSLLTVESDKASMEIPASHAGVVKELKVKLGDKVKQGTVVLVLDVEGAAPVAAASSSESKQAPAPAEKPQAAPETVARPVPAAVTGAVEIRVPDIGDFKDVAVIEVLVKVGDTVKTEQSLVTVESDKASMEIPSSSAGVVRELKVKLGDKINIGDLLAVLEGASAPAVVAPAPAPVSVPATAPASATSLTSAPVERVAPSAALPAHEPTTQPVHLPHASPSVRKFAREIGVPLTEVRSTGPKGRITLDDVRGFTKAVMAGDARTQAQAAKAPTGAAGGGEALGLLPWPKVDFTRFGPVERKDMSRIKKISGANLHRNWVMIPHVCNHDDADITELEAFRVMLNKENEKSGVKETMLAFLIKA